MRSNPPFRIRLLSFFILCFALVLISRLYFLQIVEGKSYGERADRQYISPEEGLFERGSIFFTTKDGSVVAAATERNGFLFFINPKILENVEGVYQKLSAIITFEHDSFLAKASKKEDTYEEIAHRLGEKQADAINALKITGVSLAKEKWRFYPGEKLASTVIGLVAYKEDSFGGRYGLEKYYDDVLARDGKVTYTNFFADIFSGVKKVLFKTSELQGDLVLTIEPTVQDFLETKLAEVHKKWGGSPTGGIIMDPKTGEILAMAVNPDFNPNSFSEEENVSVFNNPLIQSSYEMGSIIKPITMAAGLDAGAIVPETTYEDLGFLVLNGSRIANFDGKGRGIVSMQEVLNQSLNTGAAYVALKMGKEKFPDYMEEFGLGEETGIDLPGEVQGHIENLKSNREIEQATASFGQGTAMSPIITIRALSALSNGGILPSPHVVKRINYDIGISKDMSYNPGKQVIKPETSETITRMLVEVVDKALLNGTLKMKNYSVAAKTGTAQIAKEGGGGYYDDRYLHSFFGYLPAYNPSFIIFLYTVNPIGVRYASETLSHPFNDISKFLINYYEIPPDR